MVNGSKSFNISSGVVNKQMSQDKTVRNLKKYVEQNGLLLISVIFAAIVLIKIFLSLRVYGPYAVWDEIVYDGLAQNILHGKLFSSLAGPLPPGYPLIFSAAYLVSGDKAVVYHIMLVISAFISTTMIFPAYLLLKRYCTTNISIMGAVLVTLLPFMGYFSFTIMTEVLFTPLFLFSIWLMLKSYETDDKKWQILASLSTVYLYVTRSNGLAMVIAFIFTFVYYLAVNRRNYNVIELARKKSILLISFVMFLAAWLFISTYMIDISKPFSPGASGSYNMGSYLNIGGVSSHATDIFASIEQFFIGVRILVYMWDYLLIASFFVLLLLIFYLIILFANKKIVYDRPFSIVTIFWLISTIMIIVSEIISIFAFEETALILGRYVEPTMPFLIILGIIGLTTIDRRLIGRKHILGFAIFSFAMILLVVYTMVSNNVIINQMNNGINQPTMEAFIVLYGPNFIEATINPSLHIIPGIMIAGFFFIVSALMALSINNRRYLNAFLLFLIIASIASSATIYSYDVDQSKTSWQQSDIGMYLTEHTNQSTILYVDSASSDADIHASICEFVFWNKGDVAYIDGGNLTYVKESNEYRTSYMLTGRNLIYEPEVEDGAFKVYKVN